MIKNISSIALANAGDVVRVKATLLPKIDEIGNFSIETANPGGFWGTAVQQMPADVVMPKMLQTPSFAAVVHLKEPIKVLEYPVLWVTWVRVVQYLNADQVPSVKARIEIVDLSFVEKTKRFFRPIKARPPIERSQIWRC